MDRTKARHTETRVQSPESTVRSPESGIQKTKSSTVVPRGIACLKQIYYKQQPKPKLRQYLNQKEERESQATPVQWQSSGPSALGQLRVALYWVWILGGGRRLLCGCVLHLPSIVLADLRPTTIDKRLGLLTVSSLTLLPLINSGIYMAQTLVTSIRRLQNVRMCVPWSKCEKRLSRLGPIEVSDNLALST